MKFYVKTILSCFIALDSVIEQIENVIKKKARNSFYEYQGAERLANEVLSLCNIRLDLIDLKEKTANSLNKLSDEDKILIAYKYFGIMPEDENFDHTSWNYFRKQIRAIERFSKILEKQGMTYEYFLKTYMKIHYISEAYNKMVKEDGKKHTI